MLFPVPNVNLYPASITSLRPNGIALILYMYLSVCVHVCLYKEIYTTVMIGKVLVYFFGFAISSFRILFASRENIHQYCYYFESNYFMFYYYGQILYKLQLQVIIYLFSKQRKNKLCYFVLLCVILGKTHTTVIELVSERERIGITTCASWIVVRLVCHFLINHFTIPHIINHLPIYRQTSTYDRN